MINDCAFVGENLLRGFDGIHIKRSRDFFSKTFGLGWRILRSKGDIFHVNYLLQDCFVASKLGKKPIVAHAHGSDLREGLNKFFSRKIVKSNLSSCAKLLVSTPDLLGVAKRFREDAEYLPNIVDENLFYQKHEKRKPGKIRVLIASEMDWHLKGSSFAIFALAKIKNEVDVSLISHGKDYFKTLVLAASLGLDLNLLPVVSHEKMNEYYWSHDIIIDRFALGSLGVVSLEAVRCGKPVLCFVASAFPETKSFPLMNLLDPYEIADLILDPGDLWEKEFRFVEKHHNRALVTSRLKEIYEELLD
jgi:glycosyltransferase involved in cell wall biosynthesis